jgi:hypothetical protein
MMGADNRRGILAHEMGHYLGISHLLDDPTNVMSYKWSEDQTLLADQVATVRVRTAGRLADQLGFRESTWSNKSTRGLGEKSVLGESGWYYVTPNGALYRSIGSNGGSFVAQLDPSVHANPSSMFEHVNEMRRRRAVDLDANLQLSSKVQKANGRIWFVGRNDKQTTIARGSYYMTSNGTLYTANGVVIDRLCPEFYLDPSKLYNANTKNWKFG